MRQEFRRLRLRHKIQNHVDLRIIVGAGGSHQPGWISTDQDLLDITVEDDWVFLLGDYRASARLAEHVLKHVVPDLINRAFLNIARALKDGGVFRFAVPDGFHPSSYVIDLVKPGGIELGAEDHRSLFTIADVPELERISGLKATPLEYYGENGVFHSKAYSDEIGVISRSSRNYKGRFTADRTEFENLRRTTPAHLQSQFSQKGLSYTSLIIDWTKRCEEDL